MNERAFFGMSDMKITSAESTLKQFATIKKIYYAVEGNTNEFYEWFQLGDCAYGKHCSKANFK